MQRVRVRYSPKYGERVDPETWYARAVLYSAKPRLRAASVQTSLWAEIAIAVRWSSARQRPDAARDRRAGSTRRADSQASGAVTPATRSRARRIGNPVFRDRFRAVGRMTQRTIQRPSTGPSAIRTQLAMRRTDAACANVRGDRSIAARATSHRIRAGDRQSHTGRRDDEFRPADDVHQFPGREPVHRNTPNAPEVGAAMIDAVFFYDKTLAVFIDDGNLRYSGRHELPQYYTAQSRRTVWTSLLSIFSRQAYDFGRSRLRVRCTCAQFHVCRPAPAEHRRVVLRAMRQSFPRSPARARRERSTSRPQPTHRPQRRRRAARSPCGFAWTERRTFAEPHGPGFGPSPGQY